MFHLPKYSRGTLYCFSPLASLLTFIIEILFALWILFRYKTTLFSRLAIFTLVCLGIFQLAEYNIYSNSNVDMWIKIGYVAITMLPPLGIHLISAMTRRHAFLMASGYIFAGLLIFAILFVPGVHLVAICRPYSVDFHGTPQFMLAHGTFYYFYLLAGIYTLAYSIFKRFGDTAEEKWMLASYVAFLLPSALLFYFNAISTASLPSIMCGFAILFAVILFFQVIPRYYKVHAARGKRNRKRAKK